MPKESPTQKQLYHKLFLTLIAIVLGTGLFMMVATQITETDYHKTTAALYRRTDRNQSHLTNPGPHERSNLSPLPDTTYEPMDELERRMAKTVLFGGEFESGRTKEKMAIVVPFRDRWKQLPVFLRHMHPFLQRQNATYGIFIINQNDKLPFNRAALFNIGFKELSAYNYTCFIFHDVDLLPESDETKYECRKGAAIHYAELLSSMKYTRIYDECAGGVTSFGKTDYERINGFSNSYWGWGGEDDDLYARIVHQNLTFVHQNNITGRYTTLSHIQQKPNENRFSLLNKARDRFERDGLNSLKYDLETVVMHKLYTMLFVNLGEMKRS